MPTYVAFLRAINLGATRVFSPGQIRAACEAAGCTDVATHINTGNVRLTTRLRSVAAVEAMLETAFAADRGFAVPTIAFVPSEVVRITADADELAAARPGTGRHYVSLLKLAPPPEAAQAMEAASTEAERAVVRGRAVHLLLGEAYHTARLTNAAVEKLLGVATNRNVTVIRAVAAKWCT